MRGTFDTSFDDDFTVDCEGSCAGEDDSGFGCHGEEGFVIVAIGYDGSATLYAVHIVAFAVFA